MTLPIHGHKPRRLVVVGGGISGLAAALRLQELAPLDELLLIEAGDRLGGLLETVRRDGFLAEQGADSFITDVPAGLELCRRQGFESELIPTRATERRALVVHRGRLFPLPAGFLLMAPERIWPLLCSPLLSLGGKLRLACEPFMPPRPPGGPEESLAEFATRRLGREVFERLVEPLVAGIYSAEASKLSVAATLPRFLEMEGKHGSLFRAARRERRARRESASENDSSGARYGLFVAPRDGMSSLVGHLSSRLPPEAIRLGTAVSGLTRAEGRAWRLTLENSAEAISADAVILATPAYAAARLLAQAAPAAAALLDAIPHAGCAVVSLGYRLDQGDPLPAGFGFVVPAIERRPILAASFSSAKFSGRAPDAHALVRVFIGGARQEELFALSDDALRRIATEQLAELLGLRQEPVLAMVRRWPRAMPQYQVGHLERISRLERELQGLGPLALAGNACHGVGIPQCIRQGELAAEEALRRCRAADEQAI